MMDLNKEFNYNNNGLPTEDIQDSILLNDKDVERLKGKVYWCPSGLMPGVMIKVKILGVNLMSKRKWVLVKELGMDGESDFSVVRRIDYKDLVENGMEDDLTKELTGRVIDNLIEDPDNNVVIVTSTFDETRIDKLYRQYCIKRGRKVNPIQVNKDKYVRPVAFNLGGDLDDELKDLLG